jgi:hypothetical protein
MEGERSVEEERTKRRATRVARGEQEESKMRAREGQAESKRRLREA